MEMVALVSAFISVAAGIVFFILLIMIYLKLDAIAELLKAKMSQRTDPQRPQK